VLLEHYNRSEDIDQTYTKQLDTSLRVHKVWVLKAARRQQIASKLLSIAWYVFQFFIFSNIQY
jgi:hypothetical protein